MIFIVITECKLKCKKKTSLKQIPTSTTEYAAPEFVNNLNEIGYTPYN